MRRFSFLRHGSEHHQKAAFQSSLTGFLPLDIGAMLLPVRVPGSYTLTLFTYFFSKKHVISLLRIVCRSGLLIEKDVAALLFGLLAL